MLFTVLKMDKIHRGDTVLGNAQPFLAGIAVLVDLDRFLQGQLLPDLLLWGIGIRHDKPGVSMGTAGICGIQERLFPSLGQPIIAGTAGIVLTGKIQQDIVHRFLTSGSSVSVSKRKPVVLRKGSSS